MVKKPLSRSLGAIIPEQPRWTQTAEDTWELGGVGKVVRRTVLRVEGDVVRYLPYVNRPGGAHDNQCINNGWQRLEDAQADVEAYLNRLTP